MSLCIGYRFLKLFHISSNTNVFVYTRENGAQRCSPPCGVVVACLLHTQEVPGSIPGRSSYLRQVSLH